MSKKLKYEPGEIGYLQGGPKVELIQPNEKRSNCWDIIYLENSNYRSREKGYLHVPGDTNTVPKGWLHAYRH